MSIHHRRRRNRARRRGEAVVALYVWAAVAVALVIGSSVGMAILARHIDGR